MRIFFLLLLNLTFLLDLAWAQIEGSFTYDDKNKRDPFLPLVDQNGRYLLSSELFYSSGALELTGILWDKYGNSSALLNNKIVKVGEDVSGYKVEIITKNSVTISKDGKEYKITVSDDKEE